MPFYDDDTGDAAYLAERSSGLPDPCVCQGEGTCDWCQAMVTLGISGTPTSAGWFEDVLRFYRGAQGEAAIPPSPDLTTAHVRLYGELVREEIAETHDAWKAKDVAEFADGIVDSIWVLMGMAIAAGIDLRPVWAEVARANLDKLGGPRRGDGKLLKPEGWKPPDVDAALRKGSLR